MNTNIDRFNVLHFAWEKRAPLKGPDMPQLINQPRGHRRAGSMLMPVLLATLVLVGCGKALLSPDDERSQFDRYDTVRNQYASQTVEDEFGRVKPNLRNRLSPKD
ncbi:MAG: hypothetical protein H7210_05450 [Pyrinomonadaceae bacterium]|nr:hypothetical protein [Phycisphaerales bacterium]